MIKTSFAVISYGYSRMIISIVWGYYSEADSNQQCLLYHEIEELW